MRGKQQRRETMGVEDSSSQVSIAFPLGLSLLVALLLFICCFFCCCLHWNKLRSLFLPSGVLINPHPHIQAGLITSSSHDHHKPSFALVMIKQKQGESLPVMMPGDEFPKFVAVACPRQPPTEESRITIQVHKAAAPSG